MSIPESLPGLNERLSEAAEKAGKYEWAKAAEMYRHAIDELDNAPDSGRLASLLELEARCHFKAAFQQGTRDEFKRRMEGAERCEKQAAGLYEKRRLEVRMKQALARSFFASFWLLDELNERRTALQKCISLAEEAARTIELGGDKRSIIESLRDLVVYEENAVYVAADRKQLLDHFEKAVESAWRVIEDFQNVDDLAELETASVLVQLYSHAEGILEQPRYDELEKKLAKFTPRINELSVKIGTANAAALASEAAGVIAADLEGDIPKAMGSFEEHLSTSKETGDYYLLGRVYRLASAWTRFSGLTEEYSDKRREQLEKAINYASGAIQYLKPSMVLVALKYAYKRYLDSCTYLALTVETDFEKKRALLRKSIEITKQGLVYDAPLFAPGIAHELSKAIYFLASMKTTGPEESARLLTEALPLREETVRTVSTFSPHSWNRGVMLNYLALIRAELGRLESDDSRRAQLLKLANSDMQQCIEICSTAVGPAAGKARVLAQYLEWHGDVLQELYETTEDASVSNDAISSYREAISYLSKSGTIGPVPAIRWKIARCHDSLREFVQATECFRQAAQEYKAAGMKLEPLAKVFEGFAQYMGAWAIVEEARLNHEREQYAAAAEHYAKVAEFLRGLKPWDYLSIHYSACSFLELGEAMSRQERYNTALESFNSAQKMFQNAGAEVKKRIISSSPSEREELNSWLEITQSRSNYSWGRSQLEEAKLLDSRMEEEASSVKYKAASDTFRNMLKDNIHSGTRVELEGLGIVCEAWAKMKNAEVRASPELYAEAANIFTLAEAKATGKKMKLAALANASMCKALEYGNLFRRTRDTQLYQEIKRNLETAADFYEEAGIKKAADWTRATQRLFDALRYLHDAEIETEVRKRAELFHLAENHLQLAASIYGEAGYLKKKQEALRHLERAREEKQLLLMPVEVLSESPATSDVTISPMLLFEDKVAGVEKFRDPHLQGSITVSGTQLNVGDKLILDVEVVNVGKETATLGRVENLASEHIDLVEEKETYRIEDRGINLRGKRIDHLKSHKVKIVLRPRRKGAFELRPRITYFDDRGNVQVFEFEPTTVAVREIGVLGWIRGPQ